MSKNYRKIQPQWWGKTAVDVFLGLGVELWHCDVYRVVWA